MGKAFRGLAVLLTLLPHAAGAAEGGKITVTVRPEQTGVEAPLFNRGEPGRLARVLGGKRVVVQGQAIPTPDGKHRVAYLLPPEATAGTGTWEPIANAGAADPFEMRFSDGGKVEVTEGGRPVLVFNVDLQGKDGVPERYRRADYCHPLYDLDGAVLTDDFPKDHLHHRGLYWAWEDVNVGGKRYDPWTCIGMQQRFRRWVARETGPVCAVLAMENGWYVGEDSKVRESVWLYVYRAGPVGRAIDVALTLEAEDQPVILRGQQDAKKGYGGFNFRFAPREPRSDRITIASGPQEKDGVQVRSPWADFSAKFAGAQAVSGAAVFDHPKNPGYPNPWLLRYYGFLNPTWPGLETVTLEPGKPVLLRYRVWIHRGDAEAGKVAAAHALWRERPFGE